MNQDYYAILGLEKSATSDDIKKAYRKLAMQYHPDVNKTAGAEAKMKEINIAYETLSDPQKKQSYDLYGTNTQSTQSAYQSGYTQQGYGDMDDFLRAFFQQQQTYYQQQSSQRQRQQQQQPQRTSLFVRFFQYLLFLSILQFIFSLFVH